MKHAYYLSLAYVRRRLSRPNSQLSAPLASLMSAKPKLYHLQFSQSLRVLWLLKFLNLDYDSVLIPRRASRNYPELSDVHSLGKAPILEINEHVFTETRLCMQQLKDWYSNGCLDKASEEKLRDDYFTEFATATFTFALQLVMVFDVVGLSSPWLIRPLMRLLMGAIS